MARCRTGGGDTLQSICCPRKSVRIFGVPDKDGYRMRMADAPPNPDSS